VHIFLTTDRLVLRRFTEDDVDLLVELDSDPEVMRHLTGAPTPRAEIADEVLPRLLSHYERHPDTAIWAAHAAGEFIGWFMLRPDRDTGEIELGYRLRVAAWGRGYATEGAVALLRTAFAGLGLTRVIARTMTVNHASRRVLEKAGLRLVGTVRPSWAANVPGAEHGDVEYAAERDDWLTAH
jgi:RimJ/RimL family protein N-acetyltransferase